MMHIPAHKQPPVPTPAAPEEPQQMELDFDSDEPLACPIGRVDGEPCESCT